MADNEAARANFEELKGHIDLASKRIRALQPGTESHTQSLEDLEDYYERTVQLRKIQADTAITERDEARNNASQTILVLFGVITVLLVAMVLQYVWLAPESATTFWTSTLQPYATIDRVVLLATSIGAICLWQLK